MTTESTRAVLDKEHLRELVADVLDLDPAKVTDDANFFVDLDADSLMGIEVAVRLEKRYGVAITEPERLMVVSVNACHDLLARKLGSS